LSGISGACDDADEVCEDGMEAVRFSCNPLKAVLEIPYLYLLNVLAMWLVTYLADARGRDFGTKEEWNLW
jgi:hypothetical protein